MHAICKVSTRYQSSFCLKPKRNSLADGETANVCCRDKKMPVFFCFSSRHNLWVFVQTKHTHNYLAWNEAIYRHTHRVKMTLSILHWSIIACKLFEPLRIALYKANDSGPFGFIIETNRYRCEAKDSWDANWGRFAWSWNDQRTVQQNTVWYQSFFRPDTE